MKKQSSTRFLMWVMVIWLHAHFSVAAVLSMSKSNDTTTSVLCDGSVENCLNVHHLDSQLPTISSSHFRRILAGSNGGITKGTNNPKPFLVTTNLGYRYISNGNQVPPGGTPDRCANKYSYDRTCYNINLPP